MWHLPEGIIVYDTTTPPPPTMTPLKRSTPAAYSPTTTPPPPPSSSSTWSWSSVSSQSQCLWHRRDTDDVEFDPSVCARVPVRVPTNLRRDKGHVKTKHNYFQYNFTQWKIFVVAHETKSFSRISRSVQARRSLLLPPQKKCVGGGGFPQFLLSCNLSDSYNDSTLHIWNCSTEPPYRAVARVSACKWWHEDCLLQ